MTARDTRLGHVFSRLRWAALAVPCVAMIAACGGSQPPAGTPDSTPVARVGNDTITLGVFNARLQSTLTSIRQAGGPATGNSAMQTQLRVSVLRSLILDAVIAQEAAYQGLAATDAQVAAQVSVAAQQAGSTPALQTALAQAGGSITQLRDEIRSQLNEQRLEEFFAGQRAQEIENQLASGASFTALATSMSDDSGTSTKGGDLGTLTAGDLTSDDADFAAAVKSLTRGAYTKVPVHDSGGYDIIQLYAKTGTTWSVRHILVAAPTPYTVKDRPQWFAASLFSAVAQYCKNNEIHIYVNDAGANPCSGAPSPAPGPSASG